MRETIKIEGLDDEVPKPARETINDNIHGVLREEYGIHADVVWWDEPEGSDD